MAILYIIKEIITNKSLIYSDIDKIISSIVFKLEAHDKKKQYIGRFRFKLISFIFLV